MIDAESRGTATAGGRASSGCREVDGLLLLDKPEGPSSNQALQRAKRIFRARKAGHTGTLDPFASGLLPIAFGEATKFSSYLLDADKAYEATLALGIRTTTGDLTGEIVELIDHRPSREAIDTAVRSFMGIQSQTPPMYSAIKQNGVPLYKLARRGEVVARAPREIEIPELRVIRVDQDELQLHVRCSKGTYIRVLGEDIGRKLGCGAALRQLRRIEVAAFHIDRARRLDDLEQMNSEMQRAVLLPVDSGLGHLPTVVCESNDIARVRKGQSIVSPVPFDGQDAVVRVYQIETNEFIGIAKVSDKRLHPQRLIVPSH